MLDQGRQNKGERKMNKAGENRGKPFDLNVEKILEDWEIYHGIREIIANAIDEETLTGCKPTEISKDNTGRWHFKDYGRGLKYQHLTQKEDPEKLKNPHVIGKFGIGLKDALATFDRRKVKVHVKSMYGDITIGKSEKHGFEDLITLHAFVSPPSEPNFAGTEFILEGCTAKDVEMAKSLFLRFSGEKVIEETSYGAIFEKKGDIGKIYINGARVAEEENFLFSYNITSLTKAIKKALNRERTNVGRTAYSERVKSILLACKSKSVAQVLVKDLEGFEEGTLHDELNWADVSAHACKLLNALEKVVFFTPSELMRAKDIVDKAKGDGYRVITIPENVRDKIHGGLDVSGHPMVDMTQFQLDWNKSFKFDFINEEDMTLQEKTIFRMTKPIINLAGGKPKNIKEIKVSNTMRINSYSLRESEGLWDPVTGFIVIKRDQLRSLEKYAGTLLHELCHAKSGTSDITSEFEHELTALIGTIAAKSLNNK